MKCDCTISEDGKEIATFCVLHALEMAKAVLRKQELCAKIAEQTNYCDGMMRDCGAGKYIAEQIRASSK